MIGGSEGSIRETIHTVDLSKGELGISLVSNCTFVAKAIHRDIFDFVNEKIVDVTFNSLIWP